MAALEVALALSPMTLVRLFGSGHGDLSEYLAANCIAELGGLGGAV